MTGEEISYVEHCIEKDIHKFYTWSKWLKVRREVLEADKNECQRCKAKRIYSKANTVHHENYVRKHPHLALEKHYYYNGQKKRNLISLCHDCHEAVHEYRKKQKQFINEERW